MTIDEYIYLYLSTYPESDDEWEEEEFLQNLEEEDRYEFRKEFWDYEEAFYND